MARNPEALAQPSRCELLPCSRHQLFRRHRPIFLLTLPALPSQPPLTSAKDGRAFQEAASRKRRPSFSMPSPSIRQTRAHRLPLSTCCFPLWPPPSMPNRPQVSAVEKNKSPLHSRLPRKYLEIFCKCSCQRSGAIVFVFVGLFTLSCAFTLLFWQRTGSQGGASRSQQDTRAVR